MTKIASGGLAEQDGRLRLGDKLLKVSTVLYVVHDHSLHFCTHVTECTNLVCRPLVFSPTAGE